MRDALRLSRGMSYKNAMAGLPMGGGKAVVLLDAQRTKTPRCSRRSATRSTRSAGAT
jgi:glutamate dehydrogenase/leucine dehydrogenase